MNMFSKMFNRKPESDLPTMEEATRLHDNPVVGYVDSLMYNMAKNEESEKVLKPDDIPVVDKFKDVEYQHVINRIKVLAGLNPFPSKEEVQGVITLTIAQAPYELSVNVAPNDECCRIEITKVEN